MEPEIVVDDLREKNRREQRDHAHVTYELELKRIAVLPKYGIPPDEGMTYDDMRARAKEALDAAEALYNSY